MGPTDTNHDMPIDRGSTGSRGSFDPPLLEVGGQAIVTYNGGLDPLVANDFNFI